MFRKVYHGRERESSEKGEPYLPNCQKICTVNLIFQDFCAINRKKFEVFRMHRERVSENVFWFQSEIYAQVTAGVVAGPQWAVVIDT
jgi:hypothetical protein